MKTTDFRTTASLVNSVSPLSGDTAAEVRCIGQDNLIKNGIFSTYVVIPRNIKPYLLDAKGRTYEVPNTFSFNAYTSHQAREGYFNLLLLTTNAFTLQFEVNHDYGYDIRIGDNNTAYARIGTSVYIKNTEAFFKAFPIAKNTRITTANIRDAVSDGITSILRTVLRSSKNRQDFIRKCKKMYTIFESIGLFCTWIDCLEFGSSYEEYHKQLAEKIKAEKEKEKEHLRKLIEDHASQMSTTIARGMEVKQPPATLDAATNKINQVYADAKREIRELYEEEEGEFRRETRNLPLAKNNSALLVDGYSNHGYRRDNDYRKPALVSGNSGNYRRNGYRQQAVNNNARGNHHDASGIYNQHNGGDYYFVNPHHDNDRQNKKESHPDSGSFKKSTFYGDKGYDE